MSDTSSANALLAGGDASKGILSLFSGIIGAGAVKEQSNFTKDQLLLNQQISGLQEQQATDRGDFEAELSMERTANIVGEQRASQAAQGVSVETGTAKAIQDQTKEVGAEDVNTIHNNAALQAWGYKIAGLNDKTNAIQTDLAGKTNANAKLLEGGINAFGSGIQAVNDLSK